MTRDTVTIDNRRTHLALRFTDSNGMIAEAHLDWDEVEELKRQLMREQGKKTYEDLMAQKK